MDIFVEEVEGYGVSDGKNPPKWNGIIGALLDKVIVDINTYIQLSSHKGPFSWMLIISATLVSRKQTLGWRLSL